MAVDVCHDLPIKLMKSTEVIHFLPPQMPPPSVALDLPKGKLLKTIIEKMTKFAKHVTLTACQSGRIALKADHSSVAISTYYSGLQPRYVGQLLQDPETSVDNTVTVKLNLRKLSAIINMNHLNYEHATLYFSGNDGVMLLIHLSPSRLGTLSYYLPVLLLGSDDDAEEEEEAEQESGEG
eukprot:CAMPEP_0174973820 /NCGR_PEP_ID=MMETSP0004_2-20121128/11458_1 /TAXON_ID=420556 /ORGANISM="Ochromonas sp., Strain CCMP1393" /LENGTH=179 /DNA_ID=CAMNT_0016224319 /DNA_START=430 /DNA_END=969 /DNA_ORIENTATION=-